MLARLDEVRGWQEELYRDLHQHPELSQQEWRTAQQVAERPRSAGFMVLEGVGGTGVVAVLRKGDGDTVLRSLGASLSGHSAAGVDDHVCAIQRVVAQLHLPGIRC